MKFTNKKEIPLLKAGYVLLLVTMFFFLVYHFLLISTITLSNSQLGLILALYTLIFVYWYRNAKYIEYDSKGLGLVLVTKGVLLKDISNYREQRIEIPKSKLVKYKLVNRFFYKKVQLYINGSKGMKKVVVGISFLNSNKTNALVASLDKIVRENSSK